MNDRVLRLRVLALVVFVSSIGVALVTAPLWPVAPSLLMFALVLVAMLSEMLAVEYSSINLSITYAVSAAATILLGPLAGAITSALSSLPAALTAKEQRLLRALFNFGQFALTTLCAGWAYVLAGGRVLGTHPFISGEMPRMIPPILLLALTSFLMNTMLVSLVVSINAGLRFLSLWKSAALWTVPTEGAMTVLALALAQVVASEGVVGLALFIVPLMIARQFYERYVTLKKTYAGTVRSLVAVIEAKDPYTSGHSERVATYSTDIARRLGFPEERVQRVELAALLHDLGKVGISRNILSKATRLNDDEFAVIKTHPEIGARIIEEVPFLSDLVPFIAAHHERVDGRGYGSQLRGEEIPIEARILGVADAFDAMTSSRPYRSAMTLERTLHELRRCAGGQFDTVIVETFAEALASGAFAEVLPDATVPREAI